MADAQQWSNFRVLLRTHSRLATDLVKNFKEHGYLREEVEFAGRVQNREKQGGSADASGIDRLWKEITRMGSEGEAEITKLYERTKEMIELVSRYILGLQNSKTT